MYERRIFKRGLALGSAATMLLITIGLTIALTTGQIRILGNPKSFRPPLDDLKYMVACQTALEQGGVDGTVCIYSGNGPYFGIYRDVRIGK